MRIDEGRVLIVIEREHKIGGCAWWSRRGASLWVNYSTCMSPSDDIHSSLESGFCRLVIVICNALSDFILALVREQVLEMPFLEEVGNLEE